MYLNNNIHHPPPTQSIQQQPPLPSQQQQQKQNNNNNNNNNRPFVYIQYPQQLSSQQPQQQQSQQGFNNNSRQRIISPPVGGGTQQSSSSSSTSSASSVSSNLSSSNNNTNTYHQNHLHNYIDLHQQRQQSRQQQLPPPQPQSSLQPIMQTDPSLSGQQQQQENGNNTTTTATNTPTTSTAEETTSSEQPKKKKRQHIGYACDKCRERRVGCDRGKPICGQCKDRYTCQYSNHALRLDNVSMRQRLDELENQVGWLTSFVNNLEQDYRTTVIPRLASGGQFAAIEGPNNNNRIEEEEATKRARHVQDATTTMLVTQQQQQMVGPSVVDWAINTGWLVVEHGGQDQMKSIFTTIKKFEDLSEALKNTVQMMYYNDHGFIAAGGGAAEKHPMYRHLNFSSSDTISSSSDSSLHSVNNNFNNNNNTLAQQQQLRKNSRIGHDINGNTKEHTFTLFESLNRYSKGTNKHQFHNNTNEDRYLETDVMTRLIHQHHKCGFPTLVSPSRFENHYRQGQLKPLVLSSVFSHSVPHTCIYHPHLTQIQDFRELGDKFYNHSHDLLGIDEPANLSNIHQRTLLITYDLDLGRVRRAFLHIGIAIRMCFMLNLHRPEGYVNCKSPFEREQSKRIFWTVWFYDNMVTQLFHDQLSTIKLDQISIELPTPLPEFNRIEMDQTMFSINLIQIRKIAGSISEESRKIAQPRQLVDRFRMELARYYHNLPSHLQFNMQRNAILPPDISIWSRRNYFCILLDYCQCWITLYRGLLPTSTSAVEGRELTSDEQEAILHTSQAAVAIIQLFQYWFQSSIQSDEGFDCFFRPYLYHFMSAKNVFSANVSQQYGRSPALIYVSRAYLILLLHLYQTTPTRRSFDESQLEKDIIQFLTTHQIQTHEIPNQQIIDEALMDDPNADGGWSIFSTDKRRFKQQGQDDLGSRCSSNSSIMSDPPLPYAKSMELDLDYF